MSKRKYCESHESVAYYSGFGGLEIKCIQYGIIDRIYCVSGAWTGKKSFHACQVRYTAAGRAFFQIHGRRVPLDECIRMGG